MLNIICLSPLKFYDDLRKQNHRKSYAFGQIFPLLMPRNELIPFQICVNGVNSIIETRAIRLDTDTSININLVTNNISVESVGTGNIRVIRFPGSESISWPSEGLYYIRLKDNNNTYYYSEVFCVSSDMHNCIKIEYWNPESNFVIDNGVVSFSNFYFRVYLRATLGKPEYKFEEEATSRLGYNFIETQVSKKIFKFNVIAPEYLCDALRLIRMCSNKIVTADYEEYRPMSFSMDVNWQDQGDVASVDCEFEVDNVILNLGGTEDNRQDYLLPEYVSKNTHILVGDNIQDGAVLQYDSNMSAFIDTTMLE